MKIFITSSENKNKFGISKVIEQLKKRFKKFNEVEYSNNLFNFILIKPDILHIHGCWKIRLLIFFLLAKLFGIKIVISPHGMIDPLSFAQKKTKKNLAWFIYQRYIFIFSNLVIVNSKLEKKNLIKKLKISKNIEIIKHGITLPRLSKIIKKNEKLTFVFFSRIHPSKNLMRIVEIWKNNYFFDDYKLDIYGEIEDVQYFNNFKSQIKNSENISYKGRINNNNLNYKLSKYDIFLHPSNSENFGLVILEAMSCGLFPVVNKKIDWKILDKNELGKSLNFTYKDLKRLIIQLNKSKKKIRSKKFQKKIREYLFKNYNWDFIINEYYQNYKSL